MNTQALEALELEMKTTAHHLDGIYPAPIIEGWADQLKAIRESDEALSWDDAALIYTHGVDAGLTPTQLETNAKLARMIGHRNLSSLLLYFNADANELADRL